MSYLWTEGLTPPRYDALRGDIKTGVLVVGGGMAGILCARALREKGIDCVVAEAKQIGGGVTSGTTAVLSAQHDTLYADLIRRFGVETARLYLSANLRAVRKYRELAETIPCDFEDMPSYMYSGNNWRLMDHEARAVQKLGFPAEYTKDTSLPFNIAAAVRYPGMAQFHPLKFLYGAAEGLVIYEDTCVRRLEGTVAYTAGGKIEAHCVVVATHFPFVNSRGLYFMKMYQARSYVVALENAPALDGTYAGAPGDDFYFRNYGGLLLVGGGDRRTGSQTGGMDAVRGFARRSFPDAAEKYAWSAQDCITLDGVPYIGPYSPAAPGVYVATGFNEWGMTSSMVSAMILSDMISGGKSEFAPAFAPNRSMLRKQLFVNLGSALANYVTPAPERCPHLGCALKWNEGERTWECPCHGSRFDEHGKLLDNPAMRDAHPKQ